MNFRVAVRYANGVNSIFACTALERAPIAQSNSGRERERERERRNNDKKQGVRARTLARAYHPPLIDEIIFIRRVYARITTARIKAPLPRRRSPLKLPVFARTSPPPSLPQAGGMYSRRADVTSAIVGWIFFISRDPPTLPQTARAFEYYLSRILSRLPFLNPHLPPF